MSNLESLQRRHTLIPTYHLHKWSLDSRAELPADATSLWIERGSSDYFASHPQKYVMGPKNPHVAQLQEATRRDLPIRIGDAPIGRGTRDGVLFCLESAIGIGALTLNFRRIRDQAHRVMCRTRRALGREEEPRKPASLSMSRRLFMNVAGAYLTLPLIERVAQLAAPSTSTSSVIRKVNHVLHPEDCPFTLHVRNAIHAVMLEFTDRIFRDTHPCSMFGAFHSGITDWLGKTQQEKLGFLREAGVGKIRKPSPACWQIHSFEYDKKIERYRRTGLVGVPHLRDLFDTTEINEFDTL